MLNVTPPAPAGADSETVKVKVVVPLLLSACATSLTVRFGGCRTVKFVALVAVPPGVVTATGPVVVPDGTVAVICVSELTVGELTAVPLNFTPVVPVKPVPVIVTDVPTGPVVGVKLPT